MAGQIGAQYNIYDTGCDKHLYRGRAESPEFVIPNSQDQSPFSQPISNGFNGGLFNSVEQVVQPQSITSGDLPAVIYNGKQNFTDTTAGYRMGIDSDNTYKWVIGGPTSSADWNVTTANTFTVIGTLSGSIIIGGQIHIPDRNTTANSWHVNTVGLMWSGTTELNNATAPVRINPTGEMTLGDPTGVHLQLSGPNVRMRSSNFVTGVTGFNVDATLIEAQNILARGTMSGTVFRYDVVSATGGRQIVANADALSTAMTALDASTLTTRGNVTLAVNDILIIRAQSSGGIQEEYLRVTAVGSAPTYSVTRDLAATYAANTNPAWPAGTVVVQQGVSDGAAAFSGGWLELVGEASAGSDWPRISAFRRTGVIYSNSAEQVRLGNLNGYLGYVADIYGLGVGTSGAGEANITIEPTNGLRIRTGTTLLFQVDNAGAATIGSFTLSATTISATNLSIISGAANVANITVGTGATAGGINSANAGTDIIFWGGDTFANRAIAEFRVNAQGDLVATSATINGSTISGQVFYGSGSDGAVTIAVNTTLTRNMYYSSLTINAGFTLFTAGYQVFVNGTLTVNATGFISRVGNSGGNGASAAAGGAGGTAGAALAAGTLAGAPASAIGGSGQPGAGDPGGAGTSTAGSAGVNPASSGAGGAGAGFAGGASGSNGSVTAAVSGTQNIAEAIVFRNSLSASFSQITSSASGGGGGGGGGDGGGNIGGGGGGSGSPGGIMGIYARTIVNAGTITLAGGTGGNGGAGAVVNGGGGGGGAGGSGGVLVLVYRTLTNTGTITVLGGTGGALGAGGVGGSNGVAGANGTTGVRIDLIE